MGIWSEGVVVVMRGEELVGTGPRKMGKPTEKRQEGLPFDYLRHAKATLAHTPALLSAGRARHCGVCALFTFVIRACRS